jgi:hypothetical protein
MEQRVGSGCCIGSHAVGRLEAAKSSKAGDRERAMEEAETRGEERKRGYGCKA